MSIYGISDLHLSFGVDKPMNIFKGWDNYTERISAHWKRLVDENDNDIYFYIDENMNLILNTKENYGVNFYHKLDGLTEKELQDKHNIIREEIYQEVYEDLRVMMIVLHEGFGIGNVKA